MIRHVFALMTLLVPCFVAVVRADDWPEFRGPTGQGLVVKGDLPLTWDAGEERRMEASHPRQRLVFSSRGRGPRLPDYKRACQGRQRSTARSSLPGCVERGTALGEGSLPSERQEGAAHPRQEQPCQSDAVVRRRAAVRPLRPPGDRLPRPRGQSAVAEHRASDTLPCMATAARPSSSRTRWYLAATAETSVLSSALNVADGQGALEDRSHRRGESQILVQHAAIDRGTRAEADHQSRQQRRVRPRSRHGPRDLACALRRLFRHPAAGVRAWTGLHQHGLRSAQPAGDSRGRQGRRDRYARGLEDEQGGAARPLAVAGRRRIVSGVGRRPGELPRCANGQLHWQERIDGSYSASPLFAAGKLYFQSEQGTGVVVRADKEFKRLARNALKERSLASPAAADGALFIRTENHLFRIGTR